MRVASARRDRSQRGVLHARCRHCASRARRAALGGVAARHLPTGRWRRLRIGHRLRVDAGPLSRARGSRGGRPRRSPAAGSRGRPRTSAPSPAAARRRSSCRSPCRASAARRARRRRHDLDRVAGVEVAAHLDDARPAAGSRCPRAPRARRRVDHDSVPREGLAYFSHSLKRAVARRRAAAKRVPSPARPRAPPRAPRRAGRCRSRSRCRRPSPSRPRRPSSASRPSRAARCVWPISSSVERGEVARPRCTMRASGCGARVGREQAVDVGQQDELVGRDEHRHLRGEEVVVAEGDLVGGGRVVLVDHRHHAPVEQRA